MRRSSSVFLTLMLLAGSGRAADFVTPTTVSRVVKIRPDEISVRHVKALAEKFFKDFGDRKLTSLMVVPNTPKWEQGTMGASDVDPYYLWRLQYDAVVDYEEPLAVAIRINGNAALRLRDKHGKESRVVLAGADPLTINREGLRGEIMGFNWYGREENRTLQVLIETGSPVTESTARDLTREYATQLEVRALELVLRTDCWFVDQGFYPTFAGCGPPPSEDELKGTTAVVCSSSSIQVRCTRLSWTWRLP